MKLSKFTDYSLRVLIYLSVNDEMSKVADIADAYEISKNHLSKVINNLANLNLVTTVQGKNGGIYISQEGRDVLIGDLVRKLDAETGPFIECMGSKETNHCKLNPVCNLKGALNRALNIFYQELNNYKISDIALNEEAIKSCLNL